jgi:hypothetical protein
MNSALKNASADNDVVVAQSEPDSLSRRVRERVGRRAVFEKIKMYFYFSGKQAIRVPEQPQNWRN